MADLDSGLLENIGKNWIDIAAKYGCTHSTPNSEQEVLFCDAMTTNSVSKMDNDTSKLHKEDMLLYGLCPARDEFFLVICEKCGQLVKPQAFQHHIGLRHERGVGHTISAQSQKIASQTINNLPGTAVQSKLVAARTGSLIRRQVKTAKAVSRKLLVASNSQVASKTGLSRVALNDSSRTKITGSIEDSQVSLCNSVPDVQGCSTDVLEPIWKSSESADNANSYNVSSCSESTLSKAVSVASGPSNVLRLVSHASPSPVVLCTDKQLSMPPAIAVISKPQMSSRSKSSPSNSDMPPPALDLFSRSANGVAASHSTESEAVEAMKQMPSEQTLIGLLTEDVVTTQLHASTPNVFKPRNSADILAQSRGVPGRSVLAQSPTLTAALLKLIKTAGNKPMNASLTSSKTAVHLPTPSVVSPKFVPCKDREYDPNKHCGVLIPATQKPCTRSLTCKNHSRSLRRAVIGRSKHFDVLLQEQRDRKVVSNRSKEKTMAAGIKMLRVNTPASASTSASENISIIPGSTALPIGNVVSNETVDSLLPTTCFDSCLEIQQSLQTTNAGVMRGIYSSSSNVGLAEAVLSTSSNSRGHDQPVRYAGAVRLTQSAFANPSTFVPIQRVLDGSATVQHVHPSGVHSLRQLSSVDQPGSLPSSWSALKCQQSRTELMTIKSEPAMVFEEQLKSSDFGHVKQESPPLLLASCSGITFSATTTFTSAPKLAHHPRPMAVNGFGSWLHGDGYYVFNRASDVCRAAFITAVERSLQSPPLKKLCVESHLKYESSDVAAVCATDKDQYNLTVRDIEPVSACVTSECMSTAASAVMLIKASESSAVSSHKAMELAEPTPPVKPVVPSHDKINKDPSSGIMSIGCSISRPNRVQPVTALNGHLVNVVSSSGTVSVVRMQPQSAVNVLRAGSQQQQIHKTTFTPMQPSVRSDRLSSNVMTTHKAILPANVAAITTSPTITLGPPAIRTLPMVNTLQPIRPMPVSPAQSVRPVSSGNLPNGVLGRIQKTPQQIIGEAADSAVIATSRQSVAKLLNIEKKPTVSQSTPASFGIILTPLPFGAGTKWQVPPADKDGLRVLTQLPCATASDILGRSTQQSQLACTGQTADRRPMILSKVPLSVHAAVPPVGCGQTVASAVQANKLLLHSIGVGPAVGDSTLHVHHPRKVGHPTAAATSNSNTDSNVLS